MWWYCQCQLLSLYCGSTVLVQNLVTVRCETVCSVLSECYKQWCIAKNGGGYTQTGVAKGLKVPCLFMITEVSIRCQKKPGGWYTAYTRVYPPNTPLVISHICSVKSVGQQPFDKCYVTWINVVILHCVYFQRMLDTGMCNIMTESDAFYWTKTALAFV